MPRYDRRCDRCNETIEVVEHRDDSGPKACPLCNDLGLMTRVPSRTTVIFKGTGFYCVDSKNSQEKKQTP